MTGGLRDRAVHTWSAMVRSAAGSRSRGGRTRPAARADLAVVVTVDAGPVVAACRDELDPGARAGMPPHVTVLYPIPHPGGDLEPLRATLAQVLATYPPFDFWLRTIGRFPGVVYLAPDRPAPFVDLSVAVSDALGIAPYGGRFDEVVPHLTVALGRRLPRRRMRSLEAVLPIQGVAREVDVFGQVHGVWCRRFVIPLGFRGDRSPAGCGLPGSTRTEPPTSAGDQPLQER